MNRIRALLEFAAYQATPPERPKPGCALAAIHYSEDFAADTPHTDATREGARQR